ncbi:hypothetical protein DB30_07251 [Enhygromyxa salina]|uniref:PEGA domain-containing protein n=1 Tax=Enhygromyxa salina TaxID=215803 RepID=A0A0C1Z8X2_9BACT|nr:hypothetical protein [Enhygromyxa salina]KIG14064.1 hypothetical protein DB30_07251 [Enhygromyxa salina]
MGTLKLLTIAAAAFSALLAPAPDTDEDCGNEVCVYGTGGGAGTWKPGERMSRGKRNKEAKANRKRKDVALNVVLEGGRGSVFVDGRYLATSGDHAQRGVKPGRHEIEVRDAGQVITFGVLVVSRKATAVALVVHADR